jgi:ring-1,2-phenylacetyl-CoA epoxidase subunit PaaE
LNYLPRQADSEKEAETIEASDEQQVKSRITVRLDGRSFDFDLGFGGEPILDAALRNGADLPYACKGGVCCTCRAKLLKAKWTWK